MYMHLAVRIFSDHIYIYTNHFSYAKYPSIPNTSRQSTMEVLSETSWGEKIALVAGGVGAFRRCTPWKT